MEFYRARICDSRSSVRDDSNAGKNALYSTGQCIDFVGIASKGIDQAHACVEQLLKAIWHAEFLSHYGLYRTAVLLLADVGLEFGMTKWCRRIADEIMPQVERHFCAGCIADLRFARSFLGMNSNNELLHVLRLRDA